MKIISQLLFIFVPVCFLLGSESYPDNSKRAMNLYQHIFRVKRSLFLQIYPPPATPGEWINGVKGYLSKLRDEEISAWRKKLQEMPEAGERYKIVEPGTLFRIVKISIMVTGSFDISPVHALLLNGPLKGKIISGCIYIGSQPQKDDSRALGSDDLEDLGKLSDEELKQKGLPSVLRE